MANCSVLWIKPDIHSELDDNDIYQEARYGIPLFWLALFTQEDIQIIQDEADGALYPVFRATIKKSITTFQSKFDLWTNIFHDEQVNELAEKFIDFLGQYQNWVVELDINQITAMDLESESCTDFKNGMIKIVDIMDHILSHPQAPIPANSWLPKKVKLLTTQDRILYLDGFGKLLIPYPEFDAQLEKNDEQVSKSKKIRRRLFLTILIVFITMIIFHLRK